MYDEDGIKIAYIIYFGQDDVRSLKALGYTEKEILKREDVDAILYTGTMNMK